MITWSKTKRRGEFPAPLNGAAMPRGSALVGVAVGVDLSFADLALHFASDFLGLALELFAGVAGGAADCVAGLALDFLAEALDLVLGAIASEVVCHDAAPLNVLRTAEAIPPR